jgi:hypothetical protein
MSLTARLRQLLVATCALVTASANAAGGATIISPPLRNQSGHLPFLDTFICTVINTGKRPATGVTIELVDGNNNVFVAVGPLDLLPSDERTIFWESDVENAYCRVEGKVSKKRTLVTLCNATTPDVESVDFRCYSVVTTP